MKVTAPTSQHLSRIYYELALLGARAVGSKKPWPYKPADGLDVLILASEMSRYDPRLFGVVVEYLCTKWQDLNPHGLRQRLMAAPTPQALLCAFAFAASAGLGREFELFYRYVAADFQPLPPQLFFKSLYAPASKNMQRAAEEPVAEYVQWGFLSRERPVLHEPGGTRLNLGHLSPQARANIALRLAERKGGFSLKEYLAELDDGISRQQALADLKAIKRLKLEGRGRGSVWRLA